VVDEAPQCGDDVVHSIQRTGSDCFDVEHGLGDLDAGQHLPGRAEGCGVALPFMPGEATHAFGNVNLVDATDDVLVLGSFNETIDLGGGGSVPSAGAADIYVAKYDAAGGLLWNRTFGGAADDNVNAATTDAAGNVYFTGGFYAGSLSFGGSTFTNAASFTDMYVAKIAF